MFSCNQDYKEINNKFIENEGEKLINSFKNYLITYENSNLVVNYYIDKNKHKLINNKELLNNNERLWFDNLIRFIYFYESKGDTLIINFVNNHHKEAEFLGRFNCAHHHIVCTLPPYQVIGFRFRSI